MTTTTTHPLVGKTIAGVTEREMVARDTYKDTVTYTEVTLTFTDGSTHVYALTHQDMYSPTVYDPNAPQCECGAVLVPSAVLDGRVCNECGAFQPAV